MAKKKKAVKKGSKFPRREPEMTKGYRATDGTTFDNNRDAEVHQRGLDFAAWYTGPNGSVLPPNPDASDLYAWLINNEVEVRQALGDVE